MHYELFLMMMNEAKTIHENALLTFQCRQLYLPFQETNWSTLLINNAKAYSITKFMTAYQLTTQGLGTVMLK
jgi:hypothetical protein